MNSHEKVYKSVEIISVIFGASFAMTGKYSELKILLIIALQAIFVAFTICFYSLTKKILIYLMILIIQTVGPLVIEIFVNMESFKKRSTELKILQKFKKLRQTLPAESQVKELKELTRAKNVYLFKFFILFVFRVVKLFRGGVIISLNMMIPELVISASLFAFTFYVDWLSVLARSYSRSLLADKMVKLRVKQHYMDFYKQANLLLHRFSISLFLNTALNFIILIISLYYIFLRIVYGPMKSVAPIFLNYIYSQTFRLITFAYIVQPLMNLSTVYFSCHKCAREVII